MHCFSKCTLLHAIVDIQIKIWQSKVVWKLSSQWPFIASSVWTKCATIQHLARIHLLPISFFHSFSRKSKPMHPGGEWLCFNPSLALSKTHLLCPPLCPPPASSVSPVVQMGLSLLSEQQPSRPGSIVTWEAAAGARAGRKLWERWMVVMRWPDWTGRQRHHGCPSGFQAGRGVATPSLPGGRPSPALHTPLLHHAQLAAGDVTGGRWWRWTAEALNYILCHTLLL